MTHLRSFDERMDLQMDLNWVKKILARLTEQELK